jgi:hypothetical protein
MSHIFSHPSQRNEVETNNKLPVQLYIRAFVDSFITICIVLCLITICVVQFVRASRIEAKITAAPIEVA